MICVKHATTAVRNFLPDSISSIHLITSFEIDDSQMLARILFRSLALDELPAAYLPDDLPEDNDDFDNNSNVVELTASVENNLKEKMESVGHCKLRSECIM